jgi:hypothetical protein
VVDDVIGGSKCLSASFSAASKCLLASLDVSAFIKPWAALYFG